jgi:hypothetical protein
LLAACFTLHSINATLAIVPQRGAGLWIYFNLSNNILNSTPQWKHHVLRMEDRWLPKKCEVQPKKSTKFRALSVNGETSMLFKRTEQTRLGRIHDDDDDDF